MKRICLFVYLIAQCCSFFKNHPNLLLFLSVPQNSLAFLYGETTIAILDLYVWAETCRDAHPESRT